MAKTILIIDDSASARLAARLVLTGAGFTVLEAENGKTALRLLDGRTINLAICDVNMPVMGGIDFVRAVKEVKDYKFMPILMLTTESQATVKQQGKEAGATAWMVKPFTPAQLISAASKLSA